MYLISTADERFWPNDGPMLILGKWCLSHKRREIWEKRTFEVLPYHWDDREKLFSDYKYLTELQERCLKDLSKVLNEHHGLQASDRFWRIIIGPWLIYFLQATFDRYLSIKKALESGTSPILRIPERMAFWTSNELYEYSTWSTTDEYNQFVYTKIGQFLNSFETEVVPGVVLEPKISNTSSTHIQRLKRYLSRKACLATKHPASLSGGYVFVDSYIKSSDLSKLCIYLGQFPFFYRAAPLKRSVIVNLKKRSEIKLQCSGNDFERFIQDFLPSQIPMAYLENFQLLQVEGEKSLPREAKVVATAVGYHSSEVFKIWMAAQAERGAKIVIIQHGGHYGLGKWSAYEQHEKAISDRYVTWGWSESHNPKVTPLPSPKLYATAKNMRSDQKGRILVAPVVGPRYAYWMYSIPAASQWEDYMKDQFEFARLTDPEVRKLLTIRMRPTDYGWDFASRFKEAVPDVELYQPGMSFYEQLNKSRLLVSTYNATTYLETIAAQFPTMMYWNPRHWELTPWAEPYFEELRRVGVFHTNAQSLATKLNEVGIEPLAWWNSSDVQNVVREFSQIFAYQTPDWIPSWKAMLQDLQNSPKSLPPTCSIGLLK